MKLSEDEKLSPSTAKSEPSTNGALRFLVVDDDDTDREAVVRCIRRGRMSSAEVESACTAAEAISKVGAATYDCIFVDYYLPDAHELSLVRMLRTLATGVPIIMFTGRGDEDIAVELMKAGVADYVPKASLSAERLDVAVRHARAIAAASRKRLEAEAELSKREAHLSAMFNQTAVGAAETDLEGRLLTVNDRYCEITGRTREELLASRMQDITHPDDLEVNLALFQQALDDGRSFEIEKRYVRPDGTTVWVNNTVSPIHGDGVNPTTLLAISLDITARKEVERQLREAEEKARAAVKAKTRFLAATNHDLRQPLQVLVGSLDRLRRLFKDEPSAQRALTLAGLATDRLRRSFDKLSEIARLESGFLVPQLQPVDLKAMLSEIVELCRPRCQEKGLEISLQPVEASVISDPDMLRSILENLIGNAVKYTDRGSVTISCSLDGNGVNVAITDTGVGIPDDKLDEIFQEYTRLGPMSEEGLGLGLPIVARQAEMLGHRIDVESTIGEGSTFRLELPLAETR